MSEEKAAPPTRREVKIKLVQHGEREFTYTGEDASDIREAVTQAAANGWPVPDLHDVTDMDRSGADPDEHLTVTAGGTVLWAGWLGGVTGPAPASRAALERLAAQWEAEAASIRNPYECDPVEMVRDCARQLRALIGGAQ